MERPLFMEEIAADGVARITLTRPAKRNAVNGALIREMTDALDGIARDSRARCLVLAGEGEAFCAGGDLAEMSELAEADLDRNRADADALGQLLKTLDGFPMPTVALVHGAAIGAGLGIVACCDIVVADQTAAFALPESRLGLVPGVIAPFVAAVTGERWARRYSLTGERFDASTAQFLGLVHELVHGGTLESQGRQVVDAVLAGAPEAQRESKAQLQSLRGRTPDEQAVGDGAERLAKRRVSKEGREGVRAFVEKRKPAWTPA